MNKRKVDTESVWKSNWRPDKLANAKSRANYAVPLCARSLDDYDGGVCCNYPYGCVECLRFSNYEGDVV